MSKLASQWIELFRAGDYGDKGTYTAADIQQIAANYKPAFHEAPIRIGHTDDDKAPAYGWLESLQASGDKLLGKFKQVVPAFSDAVERGSFKKRSVGLKDYGHGLTVRHVAFLGAVPPECKGLVDIAFSQEDKDAIEIEFSEETDMAAEKTIKEQIADFFAEHFGAKPAVRTFTESEVKEIATQTATDAVRAALAPFEQKFSEREKALTTGESESRAAAAIARVKGKSAWVPAFDRMGVPQLFSELAKQTDTITFGEGDKKVTKTPLDVLTEFMEGLKQIVPTAEVYTGQHRSTVPASKIPHINSSPKAQADPNSIAFAEAIQARMTEKNVDFETAMSQVAAERPELTKPGGISAGAV